ncbi:MAG: SIR2 family NAD-dependent protein deacylase [Candidatus Acidiferrales bacterium]
MYDLIDYLNKGSCIAFIGAGPSCQIGLPDWTRLTERVLEEIRKKNPDNVDNYEILFATQKYVELLGNAWRKFSPEFVIQVCKTALADNLNIGSIYQFLVDFDFHGYMTTNLDSVLRRHFVQSGRAVLEFTNSKSQLESVDFDLSTSIVKVHGDLDDASTLILTDDQFDKVIGDPSFEHLRSFLRAHLTASRILFLGYSLRDPDLQFLAKLSVFALRRKTPLFAVVANASPEDCDEWDRKYNIRIITYRNPDGRHAELKSIFEILGKYLALRGETPPPSSPLSLAVAQSLFMWHRFQLKSGRGARIDAFKSLVLAALGSEPRSAGPLTVPDIVAKVARIAHMRPERISDSVTEAVLAATNEQLLERRSAETLQLTDKGYEINQKYSNQFVSLQKEFLLQIELDFNHRTPGVSRPNLDKLKTAVTETIVSAFTERGAEIVQAVFSHETVLRPSANLFKIISSRAQAFDSQLRYAFINYVTEILTRPKGVHERFLEYLSKAFFAVQALDLDPDGSRVRRSLISNHTLIVDSNVLIPTLACNSVHNSTIAEILRGSKAAGVRLIVTPRLFDETRSHLSWAQFLIDNHGEQSLEVLSAALGRGHYKQNAFLDGYIRYCNDVKVSSWPDYLEYCFGGPPTPGAIRVLLNKLGIEYFGTHKIYSKDQNYHVVKEETATALKEMLETRPEIQKTPERMETESEVYATISLWRTLKPADLLPEDWNCSFLTYSSHLNRVAREGPNSVGRNITVRPDVLYEFIGRLEPSGDFKVHFKDVLLATHFRPAEYFIDKQKYARFFSPLLRHAEEIYRGSLETFRRLVSSSLTSDSLLEIQELERPFAVENLTAQVDQTLRAEVNRLGEENLELKRELQKLHGRAARRKQRRTKRR